MSHLGFKSIVYHGDSRLGELVAIPVKDSKFQFPNNEIRISYISPLSERCSPLSILQTISSYSVLCKLESELPSDQQSQLLALHASCFYELKTAVTVFEDHEVHLVAMPSKQKKFPCFWCYAVPCGLYNASLGMLNMRCLSIVFDLDETLIVANTLKSFEDRIEALKGWISREVDSIRASGMAAELKRYMDDRALLKQYAEYDSIVENGNAYKIQMEEVSYYSGNHEKISRPVIRLPEKNIVLTRINPEVRDTSVLVRLRPAWEELRSYLTAKGRKRFEVYVCTMAERDYALEMWRLLDPEANLINSKELLRRVVCVKSGARKSLLNVFQGGICHPNMAMVIDDRLKVWEDKDQPRVHVVPAFTPYYAPQAETANAVPVLCVARNVACNVRAGFFKEFDENLLRKISELFYEDGVVNLPYPPDVSNYLISEEFIPGPNGNGNNLIPEGMHGAEVGHRLQQANTKLGVNSASHPSSHGLEVRTEASLPPVISASNATGLTYQRTIIPPQEPSLLGIPDGQDSFPSETNLDMKKRLGTLRPAQDTQNPVSGIPPTLKLPGQVSTSNQVRDVVEDEFIRGGWNCRVLGSPQEYDVLKTEKQCPYQNKTCQSKLQMAQHTDTPRGRNDELGSVHERQKQNLPPSLLPVEGISEVATSQNQAFGHNEEFSNSALKANMVPSSLYISVLQEIGRRCSSKVEFRPVMSTSKDLQFSVEVLFAGEKIGVGMGKTRRDAQQQAAESALHSLADKYISHTGPYSGSADTDFDKLSLQNENGFIWDDVDPELSEFSTDVKLLRESSSVVAEVACGSNSCKLVNQQAEKRGNSPRLQSIPSKRWKGEQPLGSEGFSSSRQFKNGQQVL